MENAYQDALNYIIAYIDFSLTHQENIAPEKFNLDRMDDFLAALENPHQQYPSIHVAGTKGKGSVAVLCAAALKVGGCKVGLYTSPHLQDFTERIQVNGQPIPKRDFVELVEKIKPVVERIPGLTAYEIQTALAFWYFAQQQVDIAVVEVGLGGRLDSTNVVIPLVSVITSLSLDHTFVLGVTLAEIAGEKGGIIKPKVPVVSAPQKPEALQVLERIAEEKEASLTLIGREVNFQPGEQSLAGQSMKVIHAGGELELKTKLLGDHQFENAAVAYAALAASRTQGLNISDEAIAKGFTQAVWPGRFERVQEKPSVVFDGAHNQDSAKKLGQAVRTFFPKSGLILLFGASEDKDVAGMFEELLPLADVLIPIKSAHPRAISVEDLTALAGDFSGELLSFDDIPEVLNTALEIAAEDDLILATGSLYLVGEVRQVWFDQFA